MDAVKSPAEQRVILPNVSWETYERLIAEREERRAPRFFYDRGVLEIVSPSPEHESAAYYIGLLVAVFAGEMNVDLYGVGSTTYKREDIGRGFEPDASFYVRNAGLMRGKTRIALDTDPPPDLVIEVDITSPSLDKFPIYARIGVPEVWRHDGERVAIFELRGEQYVEISESAILPPLTHGALSDLIKESASLDLSAWMHRVRDLAQGRGTIR